MQKFEPHKITADWSRYERRPTWSTVNSRELAAVLGVHLQTISNWKLRGILPQPLHIPETRENCNWYKISTIRSWLENKPEDEIHWEWIRAHLPKDIKTLGQAQYVCKHAWKILEVDKPRVFP